MRAGPRRLPQLAPAHRLSHCRRPIRAPRHGTRIRNSYQSSTRARILRSVTAFDLKAGAPESVQVKIEPPRLDEHAISKRAVSLHALTVVENGSIRRIAGIAADDSLRKIIYDPYRFIEDPLIGLRARIADVSGVDEQLAARAAGRKPTPKRCPPGQCRDGPHWCTRSCRLRARAATGSTLRRFAAAASPLSGSAGAETQRADRRRTSRPRPAKSAANCRR